MKKIVLLICFLSLSISIKAQEVEPYQEGEKIVYAGDSITHGGHYHSYVWLYYMTRFPNRRIEIMNAGIGGDVAEQIYDRLQQDILSKNPDVLYLNFGMNDTGYFEFWNENADSLVGARIKNSHQYFTKIVEELQQHPKMEKVILNSSLYDETAKHGNDIFGGKNDALLEISKFQKEVAQENNWRFIDLNRPMVDITLREQKRDSLFSLNLDGRVHPNNVGHMVMAYLILKAQGLSGTKVADVRINAKRSNVENSAKAKISNLSAQNDGISFNYMAESLPYPVDSLARHNGSMSQKDALDFIPFTKKFNQELLSVTQLDPDQKYKLKIDGITVGSWSGKEFADGINLATKRRTPQYQQSVAIMHLNEERWNIERRLRRYAFVEFSVLQPKGLLFEDDFATVDTLARMAENNEAFMAGPNFDTYLKARHPSIRNAWRAEMQTLQDQIYIINKPQERHVEIIPAGDK